MHFIRIKCYYLRQDHCKFLAKLIIVAIFFTKNRKEHIVPTYNILFCHHHTLFSYFQTFVIVVASFWCCCCCTLLLLLLHPSVSIVSPPDLKGIALTIDRLACKGRCNSCNLLYTSYAIFAIQNLLLENAHNNLECMQ